MASTGDNAVSAANPDQARVVESKKGQLNSILIHSTGSHLTNLSMDNIDHQHGLPIRSSHTGLLSQEIRLKVPTSGAVHRHLPTRGPRSTEEAWDTSKEDRVCDAIRGEGLQQRSTIL